MTDHPPGETGISSTSSPSSVSREDAQLLLNCMRKVSRSSPVAESKDAGARDGSDTHSLCLIDDAGRPKGTDRNQGQADVDMGQGKKSKRGRNSSTTSDDANDGDEPFAIHKPVGMTAEQWAKKTQKMKGNRLAAKRCRERKKMYIEYLEKRILFLEESNSALQVTLHDYRKRASIDDKIPQVQQGAMVSPG